MDALLSPSAITGAPAPVAAIPDAFLLFAIGSEEYGVDIRAVQEIRSYERPTSIALAPAEMKGVLSLRGTIVPIVDLRIRLGLHDAEYGPLTVVVVMRLDRGMVGLVVDRVSDVLSLAPAQLRPVPALQSGFDASHLLALASVDERTVMLLDMERFLRSEGYGRESTGLATAPVPVH
ncbi:chemotaxis protein CheW [Acidovorax lacteus]|uniref:Chemotaxis protein CheW n=1 Tax=Acidovorax lacteus TaxID=1924988 RepID=A0ABP8L0A3_9BURK